MRKAVSYLEKAMILAPKLNTPYQQLSSLYAFLEDVEGMNRIANRLKSVEIDMADTVKRYEEYYTGSKDSYYTDIYNKRIDEYRALQNTMDPHVDQYSYAVAISYLINSYFTLLDFNNKIDIDELVKIAKSNYERVPSNATRGDYYNALLIRAVDTVQASDDTLAELMKQYNRNLSYRYLLLVGLENSSQIKDKLLGNKDIQVFIALLKEKMHNSPTEASASDWALLHHLEPKLAAQLANNIITNQFNRLSLVISERLSPPTASLIYQQYWYQRLNGDSKTAQQLLQDAAANGVKLPMVVS
jgi:hypothetical protein